MPDESSVRMLRCPTCGAEQITALECRRCRCDLGLVVAAADAADRWHAAALGHLRTGAATAALAAARAACSLDQDARHRRLMAVCALLAGDMGTAARLARYAMANSSA